MKIHDVSTQEVAADLVRVLNSNNLTCLPKPSTLAWLHQYSTKANIE